MMNEKRREDMARRIADLARVQDMAGTTVLEIGADRDAIGARMLVEAGAGRVVSTNFETEWTEEDDGVIARRLLDARRIPESFGMASIDVLFGVAVLEHIDGLDAFFAGARHALKPGGTLYVHGGPIWSCAKGHHLGLACGERRYKFSNPALNPVGDWTHLTLTREEMARDLVQRVPREDAEAIAAQIYESDDRNRLGYRDICDAFARSGFVLIAQHDNAFRQPPPDLREAIERGRYGGQERYDVTGITFVATNS